MSDSEVVPDHIRKQLDPLIDINTVLWSMLPTDPEEITSLRQLDDIDAIVREIRKNLKTMIALLETPPDEEEG